MGEKDDGLRLSLSLGGCGDDEKQEKNNTSQQSPLSFPLKLMSPALPFMQLQQNQQHLLLQQKSSILADVFPSSSERNGAEPRSTLRGIDVNRPATGIDCDEEVMVSSPNSTVSSVSGKRSEREENEAERGSSSMEDDGEAARKKLRLSKEQAVVLEETFKEHSTLNPKQKLALAKQLNLRPRQVEVWFQNRRARTKLKQTEVDCEYLKRCCDNLTEDNRRLQKEVNELRALKLSPQFYMNMSPPTTLTMCPQCERVAVSSSAPASTAASTSAAAMSIGIPRQQNTLTGSNQHPMPMNPWAAIFPNQSLGSSSLGLKNT